MPAGTSRSTSCSTGRARAFVPQRHARAAARGRSPRGSAGAPGGRDDLRLAVEDLVDAGAGGGGALGEPEQRAQRAHRRQQHEQVGVEGAELADGQAPVDDLAAAEEEDGSEADLRQEADERVVEGLHARGDHGLVPHPPDAPAEALELAVLAREGLDHAHAADVLLDVGGQLGDALLELLQRRARAPAVARRRRRPRSAPGSARSRPARAARRSSPPRRAGW